MYRFILLIMLLTQHCPIGIAQTNSAKGSPELVVHLLDYLAKDYAGAVENGEVISPGEYAEQIEFSNIVAKNADEIDVLHQNSEFMSGITRLNSLIASKAAAEKVSELARNLQKEAIRIAGIRTAPNAWPNLSRGTDLYKENCTSCHGAEGNGDGTAGASLDPKPTNFNDTDLVWNSSPYKFFNTIRLGVPGTGMAAFSQFDDSDVWALAFYLKSIPHNSQVAVDTKSLNLTLEEVSALTDLEIVDRLGGKDKDNLAAIASIRSQMPDTNDFDPFEIAENLLNKSVASARNREFSTAFKFAIRAYLEGIELLEPKMKANLPGSVTEIETLMFDYRSLLEKQETIGKIEAKKKEITEKLVEIKSAFSGQKMSAGVAFGAVFAIFLREGFEAVLLIIVLISILKAMGQPEAIKWVHFGWIAAVVVGVGAWFASGLLLKLSGLSRELLEGAISLLAVVVLTYVGFWLHRYSEIKKWKEFLTAKLKQGLNSGNYIVLALVAFMAVFREAFEVVLFLRAIWFDLDSSGQTVAFGGIISAFVILGGLSYFAVRGSSKIPLQRLFQVCSWTMIGLAIILAGKGIHSLQEAGLVPISTLPISLRLDLVGLYPTIQTLSFQIIVMVLFGFLLLNEKRQVVKVPSAK